MKAPFKWEVIESGIDCQTARAMVQGGWLIHHVIYALGQESLLSQTMTFVPDDQHIWVVDNAPNVEMKPLEHIGMALDEWNVPL